jgi:hypothetical protein
LLAGIDDTRKAQLAENFSEDDWKPGSGVAVAFMQKLPT